MFFTNLILIFTTIVLLSTSTLFSMPRYVKIYVGILNSALISFVLAWRPRTVGVDTENYYLAYKKISIVEPFTSNSFEPIINLVMWVGKLLGFSFQEYQFLLIFLMCIIVFIACFYLHEESALLHSLIILSPFFFLLTTNIQRQGIAVCVLFLSASLWLSNRKKTAIFMSVIATLSHISALGFMLVTLPFFAIYRKNGRYIFTPAFACIIYLALSLFLLMVLNFFQPYLPSIAVITKLYGNIDSFVVNPDSSSKIGLAVWMDILLLFFLSLYFYRIKLLVNSSCNGILTTKIAEQVFVISFLGLSLYIVFAEFSVVARLAFFAWPFMVFLACYLVSKFSTRQSYLIYFLLLLLTAIKSLLVMVS